MSELDDSDQSEDKFLERLEKKNKREEVDLDKMTRRQRMAY